MATVAATPSLLGSLGRKNSLAKRVSGATPSATPISSADPLLARRRSSAKDLMGKLRAFGMGAKVAEANSGGIVSLNDSSQESLSKAMTMTTAFHTKQLMKKAVELETANRQAALEHERGMKERKRKRMTLFKGLMQKKKPGLLGFINSYKDDLGKPPGLIRFRRAARVVIILIKVCIIVKELLAEKIRQKPWFCLIDNIVSDTIQQKRKGPRAFVTFVQNEKTRALDQLTFDVSEFQRDHKEIIRCLKNLSPEFNSYQLPTQKKICQSAFYDKYKFNRVILRKGLPADGIYFVLSGMCVAKLDNKKDSLKEITAGEKFGEEDLVCGCRRRQTVLTKTDAEILYLHRLDYKDIFNMSPDANDPKNLEICKQDVVFQHFPMARLLENPGTWSVNKYKYGRLIEKDSNDLEWIYVIKSGEARVLKYLSPGHVDLKARRKKIQLQLEAQSPFHKKRQILNFIEERDYIKSAYRPSTYHPERRKGLMSAPPGSRYHDAPCRSSNAFYSLPTTPAARPTTQHGALRSPSKLQTIQDLDGEETDLKLPKIKTDLVDENEEEQKKEEDEDEQDGKKSPVKTGGEKTSRSGGSLAVTLEGVDQGETSRSTRRPSTVHHAAPSRHCSIGSYIRTPLSGRSGQSRKGANPPSSVEQTVLPAFVQIETLHPGQVFGLRACLETEERGPSVSLVSGECEVLQINKKYFMRHCDDALYSLIRLKAKAFPDQEELIDRLDANMQWEEFKKRTLHDYLRQRIRHTR